MAGSSIAKMNENRTQVDMPVFVFERKICNPDSFFSRLRLIKQLQISENNRNCLEINLILTEKLTLATRVHGVIGNLVVENFK